MVALGERAREIENDEAKAATVVQGCEATATMELGPAAMAVRGEGEGEHEGAAELDVSTPRAREAGGATTR